MKKRLLTVILAVCCLAPAGCGDEDPAPEPIVWPGPYGSYTMDGTEYPIYYVAMMEDADYYSFVFSPVWSDSVKQHSTYFYFMVKRFFDGMEVEIERVYHNDDYLFAYEDPVYYYTRYRQLRGGTFFVERHDDGTFTLRLDVKLYDDKPFVCHYEGGPTVESGEPPIEE